MFEKEISNGTIKSASIDKTMIFLIFFILESALI